MRRLASLYVLIALVAFMATACGGIPLPEESASYDTWVEKGDEFDIVHVQFVMHFEKKASKKDILGFLSGCSTQGSCGVMARLMVEGEVQEDTLSCSCDLSGWGETEIDADGDGDLEKRERIGAHCYVPVESGFLFAKNKIYSLKLTSVAPNSISGDELVFTSSPAFAISDKALKFNNTKFNLSMKF